MPPRTLHVRCATWEQIDLFTTRKLRRGKLLSLKVPFMAAQGTPVTLGLELPNEVVVAIDGIVQKSAPVEGDATKTWIEVELIGFTDDVRARINSFREQPPAEEPVPAAPVRRSHSQIGEEQLPADERELFQRLTAELRRLRAAAVHEVLGVPPDADPHIVRRGWKDLIRKHHPDLVSRRNAPAITHLAEELTILANRAYDRLRASLAAEGHALLVGSTLAEPPGWLVAFDDLKSGEGASAPRKTPNRFERPPTPMPTPAPTPVGQGSDFEVRARAQLAQGDPNSAREVLAAALVVYPRSKPLRSLYYVATALSALADGETMLATVQLETALAHHEHCVEAARLLEHLRKHGKAEPTMLQRLFR